MWLYLGISAQPSLPAFPCVSITCSRGPESLPKLKDLPVLQPCSPARTRSKDKHQQAQTEGTAKILATHSSGSTYCQRNPGTSGSSSFQEILNAGSKNRAVSPGVRSLKPSHGEEGEVKASIPLSHALSSSPLSTMAPSPPQVSGVKHQALGSSEGMDQERSQLSSVSTTMR